MLTNILLKVLEYGIMYGVKFLVESKNPKLGIGKQLALAIVDGVAKSQHNQADYDMLKDVITVLK